MNITPVVLYKSFVTVLLSTFGIIKLGEFITILLESVSLITPTSKGLIPYSASTSFTFGKLLFVFTAAFSHNIFLPDFI